MNRWMGAFKVELNRNVKHDVKTQRQTGMLRDAENSVSKEMRVHKSRKMNIYSLSVREVLVKHTVHERFHV